MKIRINILLLFALWCLHSTVFGQHGQEEIISGYIYCDDEGPLMMVNVIEKDNTNRIVSAATTDINGNFSMPLKNANNKLQISYIGFKTQVLSIGDKRYFKIKLQPDTQLEEVVVQAKMRTNTNGLEIPEREISVARQMIDANEFAGLSIPSIDDALQGQISGLDIVSNSGNVGSGNTMRMRGVSSINANTEPLIVVNGVPFESPYTADFDFATANEEQFAQLLTVNPNDIESIVVLKDAAATAIWGSKGANGVLEIRTKRGARGKTTVQYTYRFTGAYQPQGLNMLNGDEYTMMMKEALFNPKQSSSASNLNELNYDPNFPEFENFNNNTDWVKEVKQFGMTHNHYLTLSGGGEKANYRISGGYDKEEGTVIGQSLERFSTNLALDYFVSDRIKFVTDFSFTYTDNDKNYKEYYDKLDILGLAYRKMPNQSVYAQDRYGNDTDTYYTMLRPEREQNVFNYQRGLGNPVAIARLAKNNEKFFRIRPYFKIQYELLDIGYGENVGHKLKYDGDVAFDIQNKNLYSFLPRELTTENWDNGNVNRASMEDNKNVGITTRHSLTFTPRMFTPDHYLTMMGRFELNSGSSRHQKDNVSGLPNGSITNPTAEAYLNSFGSGLGQWRSLAFLYTMHYSYMSKYIFDFTFRRDGSTKYGDNRKWGNFPGISFRWNLIDEKFMEPTWNWLSMLAFRPSWGIVGNQPGDEYLHFSRYVSSGSYIDMPGIRPDNVRLTDLRWEKTTSYNLGLDVGFFEDMLTMGFEYYHKRVDDLLMKDQKLPTSSGYGGIKWRNIGTMENKGWEFRLNTGRFLKKGDFSMSFNFNIANNVNTIIDMDETALASLNSDFGYKNGEYLTRVQLNNPYGSIYGFRSKGVYQYNDYIEGKQESAPVARDASGNVIYDNYGKAKPMYFDYGGQNYVFQGGDAIYEDINHDGNINELDIVYLGNSNPKFNGGFGFKFFYKRFVLNSFFNFRYGNDVVNYARMQAESMYTTNNQSQAVNWRWRKDGDVTEIPRALYDVGYNWLGSDRFVEDGSFVRLKYVQLSYSFPMASLAKYSLSALTLSFTANNLFCLTKYTGVDPEVGYGGYGISMDKAQTPRAKSFTANITIGF